MPADIINIRDVKKCIALDLRGIGQTIIRSKEFQDRIASSEKETRSFDPVAVAIMHGHYQDET